MSKGAFKQVSKASGSKKESALSAAQTVNVWEDDPIPGVVVSRAVPNLTATPLAYDFGKGNPQPATYPTGTVEFRFWTAAEALRRGADFWAGIINIQNWQPGPKLGILLDEGEDLNAYYDRKALNFFHGPGADGRTVYSGESPDIVCHEMGHAILDAIKPQLWDAASLEVAAFHEAFGDVSAILSAIQLPSLRTAIVSDTGGHLSRNSRLSRLAEQLGSAIRAQQPDAVDQDCLRNAANSFTYTNPTKLPTSAPAAQLSSEPHSFSRLFTGAVFDILAGLVAEKAGAGQPTEAHLLAAGDDLAHILVEGIRTSAVVPNWYAQVAAAMVQASSAIDPAYPAIIKGVFVRRAILSLHSAAVIHQLATAAPAAEVARDVAARGMAAHPITLTMALPADHYGLDAPILVQAASDPRPYTALSMVAHEQLEPQSSSEAARTFVDDLFRRGKVNYGDYGKPEVMLVHKNRRASHRIEKEEGGFRLQRVFFDCGLHHKGQ